MIKVIAGTVAIVADNARRRFEAPKGVCVMTATPQPIEHVRADVDDPRTLK